MNGTTNQQAEYHYVVVGSGAGGGPVAANLAKAGLKVLLLEAGSDPEPANYQVPVFHPFASEDPALKWDFFVRHYSDDSMQRRDPKFVPKKNGILYPRAGTLGGCTAHNAMITVYPHNSDWDEIAQITGDPSWRHENMRKYFERMEACHYRPGHKLLSYFLGLNPTRHGFKGWLSTQIAIPKAAMKDCELVDVIAEEAINAFERSEHPLGEIEKDIKSFGDPNDWRLVKANAMGLCFTPLATQHHARNGSRELIRNVQREFPQNLTVQTNCLATRVLFGNDNVATGVEYLQGDHLYEADPNYSPGRSRVKREALVKREVILAGGVFNTPQLLMLSGVGPKEELTPLGIPVRVHLPGVGKNLQDRYEVGIVNRMKEDWSVLNGAEFKEGDPQYKQWAAKREGVYTTNGAVLAIVKKSDWSRPVPDLFIYACLGLFRGYFPGYSRVFAEKHNYLTWTILKAHTRNTAGTVTLKSNDPQAAPDINFRYFGEGNDTEGEDLDSVVDGVEFARTLNAPLRGFIEEEELPGKDIRTRDEIRQFVQNQAWGHHASCTCKIGPKEQDGVLDSNFRVHGTKNLRVVDASVFPRIPGFFIVTSVYMVGEKASDVILADASRASVLAQMANR